MLAASGMAGGTPMNAVAMIAYADDVNQQDRDGNTAVWIATTEARVEVLRALLRAGANPNLPNRSGGLPITLAASNGLTDRVQLLLAFGADPNLKANGQPSASEIVAGAAPNPELEANFRRIAHLFQATQLSDGGKHPKNCR